jgi:hypothetical protein
MHNTEVPKVCGYLPILPWCKARKMRRCISIYLDFLGVIYCRSEFVCGHEYKKPYTDYFHLIRETICLKAYLFQLCCMPTDASLPSSFICLFHRIWGGLWGKWMEELCLFFKRITGLVIMWQQNKSVLTVCACIKTTSILYMQYRSAYIQNDCDVGMGLYCGSRGSGERASGGGGGAQVCFTLKFMVNFKNDFQV